MENNDFKYDKFSGTENHSDYINCLQKGFLKRINRIDIEFIYIIKLNNANDNLHLNDKIGSILSNYNNRKIVKKLTEFIAKYNTKKRKLGKKLAQLKERNNERSLRLYISYERYKKAILSILVIVFAVTLLWANFICYALYAIILLLLYIPIMQNGEKMKYIIVLHIGHKRIATRYSKNENSTIIEEMTGIEKARIITKANMLTFNSRILDTISNAEFSYIQEVNESIFNPSISKDKITLLINKNNQYEKINIDFLQGKN